MTHPWTARVLTLHPETSPIPLGHVLTGRALADGLQRLEPRGIRAYAADRHRTIDDRPAGGGGGMAARRREDIHRIWAMRKLRSTRE